jgi:hypothetical protein
MSLPELGEQRGRDAALVGTQRRQFVRSLSHANGPALAQSLKDNQESSDTISDDHLGPIEALASVLGAS